MQDFKRMPAVGEESLTDQFWKDAAGVDHPIYSKRLAVANFPNAGSANVAHGLGAGVIHLTAGFNVRKVTATNGTTMLDKTRFAFSINDTNLVITDAADYSAYSGEVVIEYCKN